ncbi:MAG: (d)CMP kinase [Saprospiraceae bacterium]
MPITIAIDGFSSCGKSTLAKDLASTLGYVFVDSGAMYRAVTLHFLRMGVSVDDAQKVEEALADLRLDFRNEGTLQRVLLNGQVVEKELRSMAVNELVSPVATLSIVRSELVRQQQLIGQNGSIVMDGRDIGTVVFPNAELKLFVTADTDERVRRRVAELDRFGTSTPRDLVAKNLADRDRIDSTRKDSPLKKAVDAVVIDNTNLTREEQSAMALALAKLRV